MNNYGDAIAVRFLRVLAAGLRKMPAPAAIALGKLAGRLVFYFSGRRRVAYADMKAALGAGLTEKQRWREVRRLYQNHGRMLVEILRFPLLDRAHIRDNLTIHHLERFQKIAESGRGGVLLTGHFGNWEFLQIVSGILGKPVHVLARSQKHPQLDEFLNRLRETHGSVAVSRGMGVRELLRCLKRGDLIGLLGDQDAGKQDGLILPFFGRKTTIPVGAFELARRTGTPVLPCFIAHRENARHEIYVEEPIEFPEGQDGDDAQVLADKVRHYIKLLEKHIRRDPSEWLWETKRWKYTWTKRILILSDGKPGHVKQSEAVAERFRKIRGQYDRPGMEYPTQVLQVNFRSAWLRKLFPWAAFLMVPFAQGRLRWLKPFFDDESARRIEAASADFIISAGASLVPLNLMLARDSRAKSIVLMKPSFPFNLFRYDLALVPLHDRGWVPERAFRTLLAPNRMNEAEIESACATIRRECKSPERVKMAVFLGGSAHGYQMDLFSIERLFSALGRLAPEAGDYIVTTSRRTPPSITRFLEQRTVLDKHCQLVIDAHKDTRPEVVFGMMALAEVLIVTEDSISMISEAIATGKKVLVLDFETEGLPSKHRRFRRMLASRSAILIAKPEELKDKYAELQGTQAGSLVREEEEAMVGRLQEIL